MPARTIRRGNAFFDERLGSQDFLRRAMDHIFPDNWSFMLGEMAFYSFLLLVVSGVYLALFFDPSDTDVVYRGSYVPLQGVHMSVAYQSAVDLSLHVRAGLLFRQIHHWAANLFIASIVAHIVRIFITGAFRKPRDINWAVGVTLLMLSIFNGFTGYSLPGDLLSGIGLRIAYSIVQSVPVLGNWLAFLFFGGQFPSNQLTHRLYLAHVFIVPLLIFGLLGIHLALIWHQKHTQFPGRGRSERRLVGSQLWPTYTARSVALLCGVTGVVVLLGGLAQINPIWLWGPYHAQDVSSFAQPDWYVGWLEGTLRLFPAWRLSIFGYEVSVAFWPAVVFPLFTFALLYAWPALERFFTGDVYMHNVLERPRDRPFRTGFCVGALTLYVLVFIAGGQDVLAFYLQSTQPPVTLGLRALCLFLPIVTGTMAWWFCKGLAATGRLPSTEPPEGPAQSAHPPLERYLPDRAWVEATEGEAEEVSRLEVMARRVTIVSSLVAAFRAKRRNRVQSPGGGEDGSAETVESTPGDSGQP